VLTSDRQFILSFAEILDHIPMDSGAILSVDCNGKFKSPNSGQGNLVRRGVKWASSVFIHRNFSVLLGGRMIFKILLLASAYVVTIYGVLLLAKFIDQRTNKLQP
jgi:hypothetical protein